jgi:hypothetical protein
MCAVYWEFRLFIVGHDYLGGFVWAFAACAANSVFVATLQGAAAPLVPQGAEIEHLDTHRSQRSKFSMTGVLIAIAAVLVGSLATFSIGAMLGSLVYFLFCLVQFPRPLHWTRGVFLAPVFTAGIAAGMWLRSVAFRILATLRFPGPGIRSVPKNFRESLFVVDVRRPVQLLPHPQGHAVSSDVIINAFDRSTSILGHGFLAAVLVFLCAPAFVYRLSIKSTFWALWPLIAISGPLTYGRDPVALLRTLSKKPGEWLTRAVSLAGLLGLISSHVFPNLSLTSAREALPPKLISPLQYLFLADFSALRPWQWLHIGVIVLTLWVLWIWAGNLRAQADNAGGNDNVIASVVWKAKLVEIVYRVRNVLAMTLVSLAFLQSTISVLSMQEFLAQHAPKFSELISWIYGGIL